MSTASVWDRRNRMIRNHKYYRKIILNTPLLFKIRIDPHSYWTASTNANDNTLFTMKSDNQRYTERRF